MGTVEVRCPSNPRKLLLKLRLNGGKPVIVEGNLIELACDDCKRYQRRNVDPSVVLVLHRFDILGELIETDIIR